MHIAKVIEKKCCTCDHWAGLRAMEEGGFVYTLENVEGICKGAENALQGAESVRALTLATGSCASWEKWSDLLACTNITQGNNGRSTTAYSA